MFSRIPWGWIAIYVTLLLFAVSSAVPFYSMWGINHLAFLPASWWWVFVVAASAVLVLIVVREPALHTTTCRVGKLIFDGCPWYRFIVITGLATMCWVLRPETHFLGDGYTLLSIFGRGEHLIKRWAEPGSIFIVRQVQNMLGGYSRASAETAFQLLSVLSGAVVINNLVSIARYLSTDPRMRLFTLGVLTASGAILLFTGYVEYYPLLWAAATSCLVLVLKYAESGRGLISAVVLLAISVAMHFQALVLLPGVAYLVIDAMITKAKWRISGQTIIAVGCLATALVAAAFYVEFHEQAFVKSMFVPIDGSGLQSAGYSLFSIVHLTDVANQLLVMSPVFLVLLTLLIRQHIRRHHSRCRISLSLFACGAALFLLLIDPKLGMARDWDLMSLACAFIIVWLLERIGNGREAPDSRLLVSTVVAAFAITFTFIGANTMTSAAEARFGSIVEYDGNKDETGGIILAHYYVNKGDYKSAGIVAQKIAPNNSRKADIYELLGIIARKNGKLEEAASDYSEAIRIKPYQTRLKNELGQIFLAQGNYKEALSVFKRAHREDPDLTFVSEGLGLTYYYLGDLDSAMVVAQDLFSHDPNSPGGHLLAMIVAIRNDQQEAASMHYQQFLEYGKSRSDWASLMEHYRFLTK